jgi:predicted nucleotidyltransferase
MEIQALITDITNRLKQVHGVTAIVLGGSRAKGTHSSNSDIDIGIYYDSAKDLDLDALQKVATEIDDDHRENLITKINEWGKWVNGGGWLVVQDFAVDFLFRDLNVVSQTINYCLDGKITIDYYPGHPHGFLNSIYLAETSLCQILWDPNEKIADLKSRILPFSETFKKAMIEKFLWEASFSLGAAKKVVNRGDTYYAAGCCFRTVSCLNQVLSAINEQYCTNEKGAVPLINSFQKVPDNYKDRINHAFDLIKTEPDQLTEAIHNLEMIIQDTEELVEKN